MTIATLHFPTSASTVATRSRTTTRGRTHSRRVSVVAAAVGGFAGLTMALLGPTATPSERSAPSVIHRRPIGGGI